jgi:hypothetical protein
MKGPTIIVAVGEFMNGKIAEALSAAGMDALPTGR